MPIPFNIAGHTKPVVHNPGTLKTGLISLWEMDESSGALVDAHGSNNLTTYNTPTYSSTGRVNTSIKLAGTTANEYMRYTTSDNRFTPAAAHSVSQWVYRVGNSVADSQGYLASKYFSSTGFRVYVMGMLDSDFGSGINNRLSFSYYDSANTGTICLYTPPTDIWTGNWTLVTSVRSGSSLTLYANAKVVATASGGNGSGRQTSSTNVMWCLGAAWKSSTTPDLMFNGHVDQTGVWSKALTQDEVTFLYNNKVGVPYTDW